MRGMVWDGSLALGHAEIDRQHEKLVGLINRLAAAWDAPDREAAVMRAITDMYLYANEHFREEEALMAATGYPGLAGHVLMHRDFVERAHAFADASLADREPFEELLEYLVSWLEKHIRRDDARIARHMAGLG